MCRFSKKGNGSLASNHCLISLISIARKLIQSVIANSIRTHLEYHEVIRVARYDFTSGHLCLINLFSFCFSVSESFDSGEDCDAIHLQ